MTRKSFLRMNALAASITTIGFFFTSYAHAQVPQGMPSYVPSDPLATSIATIDGVSLIESFWFDDNGDNIGYSRECPIYNGTVLWGLCSAATSWNGPFDDSSLRGVDACLPSENEIQAKSDVAVGNTYLQSYWVCDQGYTRELDIVQGEVQFDDTPWSDPIDIDALPGVGSVTSQDDYVLCDQLHQTFWRGSENVGQAYERVVPIDGDGTIQWGLAGDFVETVDLSQLPGLGPVQAQSNYVTSDGTSTVLNQTFWRDGTEYYRAVPISGCTIPNWNINFVPTNR